MASTNNGLASSNPRKRKNSDPGPNPNLSAFTFSSSQLHMVPVIPFRLGSPDPSGENSSSPASSESSQTPPPPQPSHNTSTRTRHDESEYSGYHLECPVCHEELSEPKVLHCGHNLCAQCEAKLTKKLQEKASTITCPLCNQVTTKRDHPKKSGLATNFELRGKFNDQASPVQSSLSFISNSRPLRRAQENASLPRVPRRRHCARTPYLPAEGHPRGHLRLHPLLQKWPSVPVLLLRAVWLAPRRRRSTSSSSTSPAR